MQSSCATHYALDNSAQNGLYEMNNGSHLFNVYCDFTSELNFIWTLVESFELNKRGAFKYDFLTDIPIQADDPQFSEYRLPRSARTHLLIDATHIRATCEFDKGFSYTDYLRGKLTEIVLVRQGGQCTLFERINIRGNQCTDCKARYFGKSGEHNHIASAVGQECSCNNCVPWTGSVGSEDSFGLFAARNPDHRCSRNDQATTQWWLGVQVSP